MKFYFEEVGILKYEISKIVVDKFFFGFLGFVVMFNCLCFDFFVSIYVDGIF